MVALTTQAMASIRIVVSSHHNSTPRHYNEKSLAEGLKHDFRIFGNVSVSKRSLPDISDDAMRLTRTDRQLVEIEIARQRFCFEVSRQFPIIYLRFDRNRRQFAGVGLNLIQEPSAEVRYPRFKGKQIDQLWPLWRPDIERSFDDKNLFEQHSSKELILKFDIDTDGYVYKITDLGTTPKSYSQHCITTIFNVAARDWTPASINGAPVDCSIIICLGD